MEERFKKELQESTGKLLACAVSELLPDAQLVRGGATSMGFAYDFFLSTPLPALVEIEERMRLICREDRAIRKQEMVSDNAEGVFQDRNQPFLAERCSGERHIVSLFFMEGFVDLSSEKVVSSSKELKEFFLSNVEVVEEDGLFFHRIQGFAFSHRKDLKAFRKEWKLWQERDHRPQLEAMQWLQWKEGTPHWLPRGKKACELLRQQARGEGVFLPLAVSGSQRGLEENWQALCRTVEVDQGPTKHQYYCLSDSCDTEEIWGGWGLFGREEKSQEEEWSALPFLELPSHFVSFLHSVERTSKLLGVASNFCYWISSKKFCQKKLSVEMQNALGVLEEMTSERGIVRSERSASDRVGGMPRSVFYLQVTFRDDLGREWKGPFWELFSASVSETLSGVRLSRVGPIDQALALLLEQRKGRVPFEVAPEQVRLLSRLEDGDLVGEWETALRGVSRRVGVDLRSKKLAEKIFDSQVQGVPYLVILESGSSEKKGSLRCWDGARWDCLSAEELISCLKEHQSLGGVEEP